MKQIKNVIVNFLNIQGVKNSGMNIIEGENTLKVSCNTKLNAINELHEFLKLDYNPCHNFELSFFMNGRSLIINKK